MAQAADTAGEETLPKQEGARKVAEIPEDHFSSWLETGSYEEFVKILDEAVDSAVGKSTQLGETSDSDAEVAPETVSEIAETTQNTIQRIKQVQGETEDRVQEALGVHTEEHSPPVETTPAPAAATEALAVIENTSEQTETEQLREAARGTIEENTNVLTKFYTDHSIDFDKSSLVLKETPEKPALLSNAERAYIQVLLAKRNEGLALETYAEAMISGQPAETIKSLDKEVEFAEGKSKTLEGFYLNMDEMKQGIETDARGKDGHRDENETLSFETSVGKLRQLFDQFAAGSNTPETLKTLKAEVRKFASQVHPDRQKEDARVSELSVLANQLMDAFKDPSQMEGKKRMQFLAALAAFEVSARSSSAVVQNILHSNATSTGGSLESGDFSSDAMAALPPGGSGEPKQEIRGGGKSGKASKEASGWGFNTALESNRITPFKTEGSGEAPKPTWFGNMVSKFIGWPGSKDRH